MEKKTQKAHSSRQWLVVANSRDGGSESIEAAFLQKVGGVEESSAVQGSLLKDGCSAGAGATASWLCSRSGSWKEG